MIGEIVTSSGDWDKRFYGMAKYVAGFSKDPLCKVGSVVVTEDRRQFSIGYNGFPRGTADVKQHLLDDEIRQQLMVHGEINSIVNSPFSVADCTLYATKYPCHTCAGIIANARIIRLVCPPGPCDHPRWGQSFAVAADILLNAGIDIITVEETA